jgi:metallophosphoesterase (TIGR03767 family)
MAISRRNLLAAAGAAVVAAAVDVGGLVGPPPAAFAAGAPSGRLNTAGRGLFSGLTTLDQTVIQSLDGATNGYSKLQLGNGEPHTVRTGEMLPSGLFSNVGALGYRQPTLALGAFVQVTDMQIVDDQSPARVEFVDRFADLPNPFNPTLDSAYRPHEFLSTHIVDAMTRAIRNVGRGPMTGLPFSFTIATGDMVDNVQYNETRWYINLLDGGQQIRTDSGQNGLEQSVSYLFALDSGRPSAVFHESFYWSPDGITDNWGRIDNYTLKHGFPAIPGLLSAARRPFTSVGLGMPWYAAMGNHDGEIQGNYPVHPTTIEGFILPDISHRSTSGDKGYMSLVGLRPDPSPRDVADFVGTIHTAPVVPDPTRRLLVHSEFAKEHWNTTGLPRGHGFHNQGNTYYTIPSSDTDLIQYITLDSVNYDGGANGRIPITQYRWLEDRLRANSTKYIQPDRTIVTQTGVTNKLFVIFAHHTLDSTSNNATDVIDVGDPDFMYSADMEALFLRYPNVVLMVVGHTHRNVIIPHARGGTTQFGNRIPGVGGFWEVSTASHIDWPSQSRLIEIAAGQGVLSIFTTMIDVDSPVHYGGDLSNTGSLASLARELAFNDPTELAKLNVTNTDRRGDRDDRNTQLLVAAPFAITVPQQWGSSVAVGRDGAGRLAVLGTAADDRIWQRLQSTAGSDAWSGWTLADEGLLHAVAIETNQDGQLEAFGVNGFGQVFHRWQLTSGAWSQWTWMADLDGRSIAVAPNVNGQLVVFVTVGSGDIWTTVQSTANATTYTTWAPSFGLLASSPAVLFRKVAADRNSDGRIQVVALSDTGAPWSRTETTGGWQAWTQVPGAPPLTQIAMTRNNDERVQLHGVDSDRRVVESSQTSRNATTWLAWVALDEGRTRMTQVTARRNRLGLIEVYGVDHVGNTWRRQQTEVNARLYTDWVDFGGSLRPDVPVIPNTPLHPARTVHIIDVSNDRYLDAHEVVEKDYQVVTRPGGQTDNTQSWILTDRGNGTYALNQVSSGRYLDAYETVSDDFRVVTRPFQGDGTQTWLLNLVSGADTYTIRHTATNQFLAADLSAARDFQAFTASVIAANSPRWRIVNA